MHDDDILPHDDKIHHLSIYGVCGKLKLFQITF